MDVVDEAGVEEGYVVGACEERGDWRGVGAVEVWGEVGWLPGGRQVVLVAFAVFVLWRGGVRDRVRIIVLVVVFLAWCEWCEGQVDNDVALVVVCAVAVVGELARSGLVVATMVEERVGGEFRVGGFWQEFCAGGEHVEAVAVGVVPGGGGYAGFFAWPAPVGGVALGEHCGPAVGRENITPRGGVFVVVAWPVALTVSCGGGRCGVFGGVVFVEGGGDDRVEVFDLLRGECGDRLRSAGDAFPWDAGVVVLAGCGAGDAVPAFPACFCEDFPLRVHGEFAVGLRWLTGADVEVHSP